MESGKVDEIIEQSQTVKDSDFDAALGYGPAKVAAKKGKTADVTANLVRTRTAFSAFEAWYQYLKSEDGLGELTGWGEETRNELEVGDTLEVRARVEFASPPSRDSRCDSRDERCAPDRRGSRASNEGPRRACGCCK